MSNAPHRRASNGGAQPIKQDPRKAEFEKAMQYAANFARMASSPIWNVADTTTKQNPTYQRYTKEDLLNYMQAPASNEKYLRNASIYMYDASSQYRRLIQYYALLLRWEYLIAPLDFDKTKVKMRSASST